MRPPVCKPEPSLLPQVAERLYYQFHVIGEVPKIPQIKALLLFAIYKFMVFFPIKLYFYS